MFYTDNKLQYPVRVDAPNPLFARALQQAIGGIEGEIRVAMQYFFQACGARGDARFRDLLMNTAAEELGHIEMLATAVALNLEGAPLAMQEEGARDKAVEAVMGGMNLKNLLSAGLSAMPVDSDGVPFDMSHIYASGNIAADMTANIAAESTGRTLAVRLYNMTDDPGMKDMLSYLIARDTMHQNQWMAALEELGGAQGAFPIPQQLSPGRGAVRVQLCLPGVPGGWQRAGRRPLVAGSVRRRQGPVHVPAHDRDGSAARPGSGPHRQRRADRTDVASVPAALGTRARPRDRTCP